jgi:hypothetical protein
MPAYNAGPYVDQAVKSILSQTLGDFELIIVDDGSRDGTGSILRRLTDRRVILVEQDHRGVVDCLNYGFAVGRGRYVARMDADDIALPHRLARQVAYLETHSDVGILGSAYRIIDASGKSLGLRRWPQTDLEIRWVSLLANPFGGSTVMIRRELLVRHGLRHDSGLWAAEDYDLWTRILRYSRGWSLCSPLVLYRAHASSTTGRHRSTQLLHHDVVACRTIGECLPDFPITPVEVSRLRAAFGVPRGGQPDADETVRMAERYLDLFKAFADSYRGNPGMAALQRQVAVRVARRVASIPPRRGIGRVLCQLLRMDPLLPVTAFWSLVGMAGDWASQLTYRSPFHETL